MTFRDALGKCPKCGETPFVAVHVGRPGMTISHCCYTVDTDNDDLWANADIWHAYIDGYDDGCRDAAPKWFKSEDMLPEDGETVLICDNVCDYYVCEFIEPSIHDGRPRFTETIEGYGAWYPGSVKWWCRIEEPPEEEE